MGSITRVVTMQLCSLQNHHSRVNNLLPSFFGKANNGWTKFNLQWKLLIFVLINCLRFISHLIYKPIQISYHSSFLNHHFECGIYPPSFNGSKFHVPWTMIFSSATTINDEKNTNDEKVWHKWWNHCPQMMKLQMTKIFPGKYHKRWHYF